MKELEEEVQKRLSILLFAKEGARIDNVGKRLSDETFWLFFEEEDEDDEDDQ